MKEKIEVLLRTLGNAFQGATLDYKHAEGRHTIYLGAQGSGLHNCINRPDRGRGETIGFVYTGARFTMIPLTRKRGQTPLNA